MQVRAVMDRPGPCDRAQGIHNVTFERADTQVHRFPQGRFDLAISGFGTMFLADPVAAFANIGRALRDDLLWGADRKLTEEGFKVRVRSAIWPERTGVRVSGKANCSGRLSDAAAARLLN